MRNDYSYIHNPHAYTVSAWRPTGTNMPEQIGSVSRSGGTGDWSSDLVTEHLGGCTGDMELDGHSHPVETAPQPGTWRELLTQIVVVTSVAAWAVVAVVLGVGL